jgi:hypothetical protein
MNAVPSVLAAVDLNTAYPPGLASEAKGRPRSQSNGGSSRSFNRSGNKRFPQGMRLPSTSYNQTQNQYRRPNFTQKGPFYEPTSRFDPFGDAKDSAVLSPSPVVTSSRSSDASRPLYTHYYYYDSTTNRPTLAYADDNHSVNTANITASTNILLDTLLNGSRREPTTQSPVQTPQNRSPSPPPATRPRAAAISRPTSPVTQSPTPSASVSITVSVSPPTPIKVSKSQRDVVARVVANMLLNRADGPSRRGRRCSQPYVKSSLSRVVSVE